MGSPGGFRTKTTQKYHGYCDNFLTFFYKFKLLKLHSLPHASC